MSDIIVKPVDASTEEGYWDIVSRVYFNGEVVPDAKRQPTGDSRYVATDGPQVLGSYRVLDFKIAVGPSFGRSSAVAAVGVAPEARRGGVGSAMMRHCVQNSFDLGFTFSSLYAFREPFYRKFGYEVVGKRLKLSIPTPRMPSTAADIPVRLLRPTDFEQLIPTYNAFAAKRAGMVVRTPDQWQRVLGEVKQLAIYAVGDPIEGYAAVSHDVSFWVNQHISEVIWSTPRAYDALLSVIRSIGVNKTSLTWYEPSDSPYVTKYMDQGVTIAVDRFIMMRVCNVREALKLLRPAGAGTAKIHVNDEIVSANSGTWDVTWTPEGTEVTPSTGPATAFTIQQLTQCILGEPSYADLARTGDLPEDAGLAALFPARPVYCPDFF